MTVRQSGHSGDGGVPLPPGSLTAGNDFGLPILPKLPKITVFGGFRFSVDSGGIPSEGIRAEDFTPPERKMEMTAILLILFPSTHE